MRRIRFLALLLLASFVTLARAQSVHWERGDSGVTTSALLVFENCAPDGEPKLPDLPGVTFTLAGNESRTNIVNFQVSRLVVLTYLIRSRSSAPVQIPAFNVKTNQGSLRVDAFTVGAPATSIDSLAGAKLMPERNSVWAGEVFGLTYELTASRRNNPQISPTFDWNAAPLVAEDWSKPEVTETIVNGERRANVTFRTRAIAKTPGTLKLEAATHLLSIQTGSVGSFFGPQPRMEQVSVVSDQPTIDVKALPAPPPGFSGAVGQFKLVSKIVPEKAAVGEPVTWTLELAGTGNWPEIAGLPSRDVSNDFQVVQPKAKRTPVEGKLFDATLTEDVVLVPTKTGSYTLGPINFVYFDPKAGAYKTVTAPRTTVAIISPSAPQFRTTPAERATEAAATPEAAEKKLPPPAIARPPAGIPRDPLPGSAQAQLPLSPRAMALGLLSPALCLLLFWSALAVRRAKLTDPVRPRREARDRIAKTLAHLHTASEADRARLLLAWQHDTTILWQIRHAAPRAAALPDEAWAKLWNEADRALYGAKAALPSDWIARAQAALAAKRIPGFQPLRLFLPQNLMPFAAALALLFITTRVALHAASSSDPIRAAYDKGDFAAAEKGWREKTAATPTDWIARHNLSLALAQQERASEAAAQAIAAFVQHPSDPSVRWHFALAAEKSGAIPAPLNGFLAGGPLHSLARFASPAEWQLVLIAAVWLVAAAVACLLFNLYGRRSRLLTVLPTIVLVLCFALASSAIAGEFTYGVAGKIDAVVVARPGTLRSIPTEADTTQKTSPLAAGALALADKTFLGWTRLAFENGQTGWVRKEEIVPLWK